MNRIEMKRSVLIMISNSWYRVPLKVLRDKKLSASDVGVLAIICDKADGGTCRLTESEIAEELEISSRTVERAVAKLSESRYIEVTHHKGKASEYRQLILEPKRRGRKTMQNASNTRGKHYSSWDDNTDIRIYEEMIAQTAQEALEEV